MEEQAQTEKNRLDQKKQSLSTTLVLSGIAKSGPNSVAMVDSRGPERGMLMLHVGDKVSEAQVTSIDERKGEVILDYEGKIQVVLRMSNTGTAQP